MYKILVTTTMWNSQRGFMNVHTLVVDFSNKADADIAVGKINAHDNSKSSVGRTAVALY